MNPVTKQALCGALTTDVFTPGASTYMKCVAYRWFTANLWWVIALPTVLGVASVWDSLLMFVALMVTFLLYPSLLMIVYYRYALAPWSRLSVFAQQITINGDTITRSFIPSEDFPSVPDIQHLTIKQGSQPSRSGRFMVADIEGKSRYEFIMWPIDKDVV